MIRSHLQPKRVIDCHAISTSIGRNSCPAEMYGVHRTDSMARKGATQRNDPMNRILAVALGATILSAPAMAADAYSKGGMKDSPTASASENAATWTGPWIGAVGGLQFNNDVLNYGYSKTHKDEVVASEDIEIDGLGSQGLFGELQLGYDRQFDNLVIGLFGGLNMGDSEFTAKYDGSGYGGSSSGEITYGQEWGGVLGPRIGFASGNSLFYVAGGWAFGELEKAHASASGGGASVSGAIFPNQDTDLNGWFGEVGMERRFENVHGLSLKVSGRYTDYSSMTLWTDGETNEDCTWAEKLKLDRDDLKVMVGLTYRPQF